MQISFSDKFEGSVNNKQRKLHIDTHLGIGSFWYNSLRARMRFEIIGKVRRHKEVGGKPIERLPDTYCLTAR